MGNGVGCIRQAPEPQRNPEPNSERIALNTNAKQRAIRFAEYHGERIIVRRTIKGCRRTDQSFVKEVLLTIPEGEPISLFTRTTRDKEPNWIKVWARAIEVLGPIEDFEVPLTG